MNRRIDELPDLLIERRQQMGLTMAAHARLAGISSRSLYRFEKKNFSNVSLGDALNALDSVGLEINAITSDLRDEELVTPLKKACDYANVGGFAWLTEATLESAIDGRGLDEITSKYLKYLLSKAPVALLSGIAHQLKVENDTAHEITWSRLCNLALILDVSRSLWLEISKSHAAREKKGFRALIEQYPYQFDGTARENLSMGRGWFQTFSDLCEAIHQTLDGEDMEFVWVQTKEKFGTARFQGYFPSADHLDEEETEKLTATQKEKRARVMELMREAAGATSRMCIVCGQDGVLDRAHGYVLTLCDHHMKERTEGDISDKLWVSRD